MREDSLSQMAGSGYSSMKDLLASSKASSPIREKASISISVMKSLVLREKDDKMIQEFGSDVKVLGLMNALLSAEGQFTGRTVPDMETQINTTSLVKDIHGAPLESFVVKLSEAISCLKTLRKMASYWSRVVSEIRRLWYEGQYIPGIPPGDLPDLNSCLLYQQLQVTNCCISRKRRHTAALESLESVTAQADAAGSSDSESTLPLYPCFYAKIKSGELVLRLGADKRCENLTKLETGEPIYSPVMQEPPLLTEDLIKETEEFVLRTGRLCMYGMGVKPSDIYGGRPSRDALYRKSMEEKEEMRALKQKIEELTVLVHSRSHSDGQVNTQRAPISSHNNHASSGSSSHPTRIRVGVYVKLKSLVNLNEIVAIGIVRAIGNVELNGRDLGPGICEVVVQTILKGEEMLIYPTDLHETIGHSIGAPIAWPLSLIVLDEDEN